MARTKATARPAKPLREKKIVNDEKILNPATGKMVLKRGAIGQKLLIEKLKAAKPTSPVKHIIHDDEENSDDEENPVEDFGQADSFADEPVIIAWIDGYVEQTFFTEDLPLPDWVNEKKFRTTMRRILIESLKAQLRGGRDTFNWGMTILQVVNFGDYTPMIFNEDVVTREMKPSKIHKAARDAWNRHPEEH